MCGEGPLSGEGSAGPVRRSIFSVAKRPSPTSFYEKECKRNKSLLGTKGMATRSKAPGLTTSNKNATGNQFNAQKSVIKLAWFIPHNK